MRAIRWWLAGYLVVLAALVAAMFAARQQTLAQLSTPQSVAQWQAWREDVRRQQAKPHVVERRVPKSVEPPALVLMRDYFAVSLFGAILFSSALYLVIAWFISGILNSRNA